MLQYCSRPPTAGKQLIVPAKAHTIIVKYSSICCYFDISVL